MLISPGETGEIPEDGFVEGTFVDGVGNIFEVFFITGLVVSYTFDAFLENKLSSPNLSNASLGRRSVCF